MQPGKDRLSLSEEVTQPKESKLPFRIGLNEGIIVLRESLSKIDLYTDGLTGCVVLAASNTGHVFMSHIETSNDKENDNAKKYLMSICDWMNKHDDGQMKFYLGGNRDTSNNFIMFKEELDELSKSSKISVNTISSSDAYKVELSEGGVILTSQTQKYSPQDILGTIYGKEYVAGRVDANIIWPGRNVLSGDSIEYDLVKKDWDLSPKLKIAVKKLAITVGPFAENLLNLAEEKIAGRNVTDEDRIKICNSLSNIMQEMNKKTHNEESKNELDEELEKYMNEGSSIIISSGNPEIIQTSSSTSSSASSSASNNSEIEEQIAVIVNNVLGNGSPPMNPAKKLRSDEKEEDGDEKKEEEEKKRKNKGDDVVVWPYNDGKPPDGGGSGSLSSQPSNDGAKNSNGSTTGGAGKTSQTESNSGGSGTPPNPKESQSLEEQLLQLQNTVDTNIVIKKSDVSKPVPDTIRQRSQSLPVKRQAWMTSSKVQLENQVSEESGIESFLKI